MIPPFADHPLIREFNTIKKYFRQHETGESRLRIKEFRECARQLSEAGTAVAFDFVGSQNFGQSLPGSDVDIILYIRCPEACQSNCPASCADQSAVNELLKKLIAARIGRAPFEIQCIDTLNLNLLQEELLRADPESGPLLRFAFYRSICRCVNARLIRPYQERLTANRSLLQQMTPQLRDLFEGLCANSSHHLYFKKYQERVAAKGIRIPGIMRAIIRRYQEDNNLLPPDQNG